MLYVLDIKGSDKMIKVERNIIPNSVTREDLLNKTLEKLNLPDMLSSTEFMLDLILDILLKLVDNHSDVFTEEELATINKLKTLQSQLKTFDLLNNKFPDGVGVLDYIYSNKAEVMKGRNEYYIAKSKLGE